MALLKAATYDKVIEGCGHSSEVISDHDLEKLLVRSDLQRLWQRRLCAHNGQFHLNFYAHNGQCHFNLCMQWSVSLQYLCIQWSVPVQSVCTQWSVSQQSHSTRRSVSLQ